jgi:predicted ABC-type ATPase
MPILYVIAGPNGIGKTTASYDLVPANTPIINSDEIAKEVRNAGLPSISVQEFSNQEAIRLMDGQRAGRNSFAIETNLADVDTWKFLLEMQKTGYELHILFMSTDNLEVLNNRIRERTRLGDHYVKPDIVEERYIAGLKLLNHYFDKPEKIQLFDNSEKTVLLVEISQGQVQYLSDSLPEWITKHFSQHLGQQEKQETKIRDLSNIDEVRKSYEELRKKAESLKNITSPKEIPDSEDLKKQQKNTPRHKPKL